MNRVGLGGFEPSAGVASKARGYLRRGRVFAGDHPAHWIVQGSAREPYRVLSDLAQRPDGSWSVSWIACTCTWGLKQGGGASACSHAVAALLAARSGADLVPYAEAQK